MNGKSLFAQLCGKNLLVVGWQSNLAMDRQKYCWTWCQQYFGEGAATKIWDGVAKLFCGGVSKTIRGMTLFLGCLVKNLEGRVDKKNI